MDILDDMGMSKLSAKGFFKVNCLVHLQHNYTKIMWCDDNVMSKIMWWWL